MAPALSAACAKRIRRAEVARSEARRLLGQGEVSGAAGGAFEAVREALLAASAAFGVPHEEDTSLLATAEGLSRATRFGCIPCRFSSLLVLGQDLKKAGYPPDRVRRMIPKALEVSENLACLAGEAAGREERPPDPPGGP
jgi:hypothetical protein